MQKPRSTNEPRAWELASCFNSGQPQNGIFMDCFDSGQPPKGCERTNSGCPEYYSRPGQGLAAASRCGQGSDGISRPSVSTAAEFFLDSFLIEGAELLRDVATTQGGGPR